MTPPRKSESRARPSSPIRSATAFRSCCRRKRGGSTSQSHKLNWEGTQMIKIWGRNTSSNVQKAMWAVGELKLAHERIDIGGKFGMNREPKYLAMNPNGLVPTLEEDDGFLLWESNTIVRYPAGKHDKTGGLEPKDAPQRALASQWMDWQLSVLGPAITPAFWGLIRTPEDKRDMAAIKASQDKTVTAMLMLEERLGKAKYVAGDSFSY